MRMSSGILTTMHFVDAHPVIAGLSLIPGITPRAMFVDARVSESGNGVAPGILLS